MPSCLVRLGLLGLFPLLGVGCGSEERSRAAEGASQQPGGETDSDSTQLAAESDSEVETLGGAEPDRDALFGVERVQEVRIELDPSDWEVLRKETRSMFDVLAGDCMAGPAESPFTWFEADVTIDGTLLPSVALRKKGFIGSLSIDKPGLKLEFDEYVGDRRLHGMERLLLNNTPQDPTMLRTCLAYDYFDRAGVPAPRCGFSHVVVNDVDYGIYATVQAVDDHFVGEHFGDPDVPLFEGTLSDLREGWTGTYDPDTPEADPALLEPLREAVESGDFATISDAIDVEAFVRFWVAEAIVGHWDGYGWNTNNYYIVLHPEDGRAHFVPWGPDAALSSWAPGGGLSWIPLTGALTRALASTAEGQALYRAELERQLTEVWSTADIFDRIDGMAATIAPWHSAGWAVGDLQAIADYHASTMQSGLTTEVPEITWPMRDPLCMTERGTISFSFEGDYGSIGGGGAPGTCSGEFTWDGAAGVLPEGPLYTGVQDGIGYVGCYHTINAAGAQLAPYIYLPPDELVAGETYTDFMVRRAMLYYWDSSMGDTWATASWVEGSLTLEEADPTGMVRGSYEGTLWQPAW